MEIESRHVFLVQAENRQDAVYQVIHFLQTTDLISYGQLNVDETAVLVGDSDVFWQTLSQGVEKNKAFSRQILEELQKNGVHEVVDLLTIPLGYPSKLLHILTHMLDGFVGIDSFFYNLVEDSHWLGKTLEIVIRETPQQFWLVPVETGEVERSVLPSATMVEKS
ncbi:MAG: hypothetical protein KJ804_20655 [Proteobacteria bacterium]|nr:hypothetical protein [Pseudomonadota bacterium]MBU1060720.1 hypothetical protein [Pseudomonadota bacterium]